MEERYENLNQALLAAMDTHADETCFQIKRGSHYRDVSYRRFRTLTYRLTSFFRRRSVSRVALVGDNCLEWMVAYVACLLSGGIAIPLRTTLAPNTLRAVLQDSDASTVVFKRAPETSASLDSLATEAGTRLPDLTNVLVIGDDGSSRPDVVSINPILSDAAAPDAEERAAIRSYATNIPSQARATIFYLTGKAGEPKGAVFDHGQFLATLHNLEQWFALERDDLAFTYRPWSELPNLATTLHYFLAGIPNALAEGEDALEENLQLVSPTVMLAAPHFFERTYDRIVTEVARMPESSQEVFRWAVAKGKEFRLAGTTASPALRQQYARADLTFFSRVRGRIGGRFRRLYSTGASLPERVVEFFEAIGLPALNVYSLTEAGGFPAVSWPDARRPGSPGRIAPGFEIRIAEDGEVLVRGATVMREYWRRPQESTQAIDPNGWLHSGDMGYLDDDDFLFITGRKQHLMVLSTGFKIAPAVIEAALTESPLIADAAVFGEGRPYVSAVLVPDMGALGERISPQDQDEPLTEGPLAIEHPQLRELLAREVGEINRQLDRWEQIKEYTLLKEPLDTALSDAERDAVARRYASQISAMYPLSLPLDEHAVTQVQIDPERLRELLEKESILDAWLADAGIGFLFEMARENQIDAPSMVNICDTVATIAQIESEEKPLSTALIVGDPVCIGRVLPPSRIQLLRHDHIRRMRNVLITMAEIVDGMVLGYVVDKYGYVRGVHKLEIPLEEPEGYLLGPRFRHHAAISRHCDAMVFFVPYGGRQVRVFAGGELVGRYANGDWSPENMSRVDEVLVRLAEEGDHDLALMQRLLRCAFQMSEENLGAIFLLGDARAILQRSDTSEISSFAAFLSADMAELSDRELINFARQDGATVIDQQGRFRGCRVLLRPDADTQAEVGPGKGARHSSAAKMSAEAGCLALTVSQDGPVTLYDGGKRILSL
jgi:long-chain acyl-CoA synthetase